MIIKKVELTDTVFNVKNIPSCDLPKIAFIGRSNVGKSSLINKLMRRKNFARSSSRPGKTVSINYYKVNDEVHFVDLPGYGYSKIPKGEKVRVSLLINSFFEISENIKLIMLLIDSRRGFMDIDLKTLDQISKRNIKILTIFTKSDKLSNSDLINQLKKYQKNFDLKVIPFSTKKRDSELTILEYIQKSLEE